MPLGARDGAERARDTSRILWEQGACRVVAQRTAIIEFMALAYRGLPLLRRRNESSDIVEQLSQSV
jgi:hypothetical protein